MVGASSTTSRMGGPDRSRAGQFHFSWLPKNRPDLLVFESKMDKWHVVHGWLQGYEDIQAPIRNPPA